MSIPNHLDVVRQLAAQYPAEWSAAHRGGPDTEAFIRRLASVLHGMDPRFGLNGKRGNPGDISDDAICFDGESALGDVDPTRGNVPVTVLDVIAAAGGPNPQPAWGAVGPATPQPYAAWVRPDGVTPVPVPVPPVPVPVPVPPPAPKCQFQPFNLEGLTTTIERLQAEVDGLSDDVREIPQGVAVLYNEVALLRNELADLIARMEQGFVVDASVRYLGPMRGTVKLPKGE